MQDLQHSVVSDVKRIRSHPLVPARIVIYGYIYDVSNGHPVEVPEVANAGQAGTSRQLGAIG